MFFKSIKMLFCRPPFWVRLRFGAHQICAKIEKEIFSIVVVMETDRVLFFVDVNSGLLSVWVRYRCESPTFCNISVYFAPTFDHLHNAREANDWQVRGGFVHIHQIPPCPISTYPDMCNTVVRLFLRKRVFECGMLGWSDEVRSDREGQENRGSCLGVQLLPIERRALDAEATRGAASLFVHHLWASCWSFFSE